MPSFDGMLTMAYTALVGVEAGARHILVISDGDPSFTNPGGLMSKMRAAKISISTVLVFPTTARAASEWDNMKAPRARFRRGGSAASSTRGISQPPVDLHQRVDGREAFAAVGGPAFSPTMTNVLSETGAARHQRPPPITGYIVGADREGLSVVSARGKENDLILAHWQFGLARASHSPDRRRLRQGGWPS